MRVRGQEKRGGGQEKGGGGEGERRVEKAAGGGREGSESRSCPIFLPSSVG